VANRAPIGLTGDDLTVADVWAVAVDRAPTELTDAARAKMQAARELVERTARASTRTA
jgi:histidine ammonia-lyase